LVADAIVLAGESQLRFRALHRALRDSLSPRNTLEEVLITKMTVAHWRQVRMWEMEKAAMAHPPMPDLRGDSPKGNPFADASISLGNMSLPQSPGLPATRRT
jgi:hypothetical protein